MYDMLAVTQCSTVISVEQLIWHATKMLLNVSGLLKCKLCSQHYDKEKIVRAIGFLHYVELPVISSCIKFLVHPTYLRGGLEKNLSASVKLCSQIQVPVHFAVPFTA